MRIATWNVNSVKARLNNIVPWVKETMPDVLLLQEIKCEESAFPNLEFESLGYKPYPVGQKSYNGVALLSRHPVQHLALGLEGEPEDTQARFVEGVICGIRIGCLYLPNGNPLETEKFEYKLRWMKRLKSHCAGLVAKEIPFVMGGDFNVIPEPIDVFDPKGWESDALFHPRTRAQYRELIQLGLVDAFRTLHPDEKHAYTFWDYQAGAWQRDAGLRIDHFILSPEAADLLLSCSIDRKPRGLEKASDHTPVILEIRA